MTNARNALAMLGINAEEAVEADQALTRKPSSDKRICLCGHAINKHSTESGVIQCVPSRYYCPCKNIRPVVLVEDTRLFLRKTNGPGAEHALTRGLAASFSADKNVEWITEVKCDKCGVEATPAGDVQISPVAVTEYKTVSYEATGFDALLYTTCLEEIR
jgi:hypothetical protein